MKAEILEHLYEMLSDNKYELFEKIASDRTKYLTVVMENVHHDHNASAVLRTCDCFGIQEMHVIEKDVQYEIQRDIARGSGRWIDLHQYNQGENPTIDCIKTLKSQGYKIVATSPRREAVPIHKISLDQPVALVFGTEFTGISDDVVQLADEFTTIPMYGFTESFNVSVSVGLALQNMRQRLEEMEIDFRVSEEEQLDIKIKWAASLLRNGDEVLRELECRLHEKLK